MVYRISVDTGGTFTDVVIAGADGSLTIGKAMTTPDRPFQGVASALDIAAEQLGLDRATLLAETPSSSMARRAPPMRSSRAAPRALPCW